MSDRGNPEVVPDDGGVGVHSFRLINTVGTVRFVKFH